MAAPTFSPLSDRERVWIAETLERTPQFLQAFSPEDEAEPITLEALDRAWTVWLQQGSQDQEEVNAVINTVGIRFGQFLVDGVGFQWTIATDNCGTDLAVLALPGRGDVLVYPANFVAKRWERQESNFLAASSRRPYRFCLMVSVRSGRGTRERRRRLIAPRRRRCHLNR